MPDSPSPLEPTVSPLAEADPNSINEFIQKRVDALFNKRPGDVTDDDLNVMAEYYRRERARYMIESEAKALKPPSERRKKPVPTSVADALDSSSDLL